MTSQRRAYAQLIFTVIVVTLGANFQIYSTSVINNVQLICEKWLRSTFLDRYSWDLTESSLSIFWSMVACAVQLGGIFGSCFSRTVAEKLGRRYSLILSCSLNIVGLLLTSFAKLASSYEMIVIGRFLVGVAIGFGFTIAGIFLSEIPPCAFRGSVGATQHLLVGFADFASLVVTLPALLGTEKLWPVAFGLPIITSVLLLLSLLAFSPESPQFLYLTRKAGEEAEKSVLFYQGEMHLEKTMLELKQEEAAKQAREKVRFKDLFTKSEYRKPLIISVVSMVGMTLTGIQVVMAYSTDIFIAAGLSPTVAEYATVGVGFCNFAVPLLSMRIIETIGRRPLILAMLAGDAITLAALSIFTYVSNSYKYEWAAYLSIATLVIYQCLYALGAPVTWIIANELFETHTRSHASSITLFFFWFNGFLLILLYLPFKQAVGVSWSFVPFILSCVACFIYLFVCLPETKGRTSESIAALFRTPKAGGDGNGVEMRESGGSTPTGDSSATVPTPIAAT